jgi:XRE family transcriptional regulator, regulator of sulfur utilization
VAAFGRFRQVAALMADARSAQHRALGQLIRVRRDALGISQEDLAHEAGMDRSHLGAIERGEGNPAYGSLLAIAEALGVSLAKLQDAVETISTGVVE